MTAGPPLDLDEVRRTNWDAVVIGAGPAGVWPRAIPSPNIVPAIRRQGPVTPFT